MELETKAVTPEIKDAFDDFLRAFESFKGADDERLAALERRSGDVISDEKVDRINRALDEHKRVLDDLTIAAARPALGGEKKAPRETLERKAAFDRYVRKGDTAALDALELKAMSVGSPADGGYTVPLEIEQTIDRILAKASPIRAISTVRQIGSNVYRKPITIAGAATGWVAETDARVATPAPTLAAIDYPAMELYAMPAATNTLLDNSQVDIEQWLAGEVQIVFAEQEGAAFISGNGTTQPKGFLTETVVADFGLFLGQARLHRQRSGRRVRRIQSDRCTGHARLCAAPGLSRQRHLGDEPQDRKPDPHVQGFDRQLHLAARLRCGPAADLAWLSRGRGRGHARSRLRFAVDRVR